MSGNETSKESSGILPMYPFALNLVSLVVIGTVSLGWVLRYTEFFPVIGGLLGLGSVFAWVAFLSNILTEERRQQLQTAVDKNFLQQRWLLFGLFAVFGAFVVGIASRYGTVALDARRDHKTREIVIFSKNAEAEWEESGRQIVSPGSTIKIPLATGFGNTTYQLRPDGLPARDVTLSRLQKYPVEIPTFFLGRPHYLIRIDAKNLANVKNFRHKLVVSVTNNNANDQEESFTGTRTIDRYEGEAVWVGARAGVTVPADMRESWRLQLLLDKKSPDLASRWNTPISFLKTKNESKFLKLSGGSQI